LRIVAGSRRGRRLVAPPGRDIRPTGARARETLFNVLTQGRVSRAAATPLAGALVLDAFAGTGALGLEALSRGAARVVFMETARAARRALRENIAACAANDDTIVLDADATDPPPAREPVDLAFLDPPYGAALAEPALAALARRGWFADGALIVVETAARDAFAPPERLQEIERRRIGAAQFIFLIAARQGA